MPDPKPTDPDVIEAMDKLKEILKKMETEEGLKELEKGSLKFEIKPEVGMLWYVAYGT